MKKIILALAAAVALPTAASAGPTIILNGSFETGVAPGVFTTIGAGDSTSIANWTVGGNSVDYIGSYWAAADGSRSVDLAGNSDGSISQTFNTVAGKKYLLSFLLGGNGDGAPATKSVVVNLGAASQTFTSSGSTPPGMNYTPYTWQFIGSGSPTTLSFASNVGTAYGAVLDKVSVAAVPEPATWGMMILGLGVVGGVLRRRRSETLATA